MEVRLSQWSSGANSDQGVDGFTEIQRAGQLPNCVLVSLSLQMKDGSASDFEVPGRLFLPLSV